MILRGHPPAGTRASCLQVSSYGFLPAEVESDPDPSTPPQGSGGRRIENRREFGKEGQRLVLPPIGDADWRGDSPPVVVVFYEFEFRVDAKIDGRAATIGSEQQVQLVEEDVPLDLDAVRVYE